jgi:HEAT repeat protein
MGYGLELRIDDTGTNARMPATDFARDLEHDLVRKGLSPPYGFSANSEPGALTVKAPVPVDDGKESARLAAKLRSQESSAYSAAVKAAQKLGPAAAAPILSEAMRAGDASVRRRACEVAGAARAVGSVEAAMRCLEDPDQMVRQTAADFLRKVDHRPALAKVAARYLETKYDYLTAASTVRNWGEKQGTAALTTHLASSDPNVRAVACLAIVQYGGKTLAATLERLALEDIPVVAGAALKALQSVDPERRQRVENQLSERQDYLTVFTERGRWDSLRKI